MCEKALKVQSYFCLLQAPNLIHGLGENQGPVVQNFVSLTVF